MKTQCAKFSRAGRQGPGAPKRSEGGSVIFIFISLLAIMLILVTADINALTRMRRETKLLEQRQVERLNTSQTNSMTVVESPAKPESK